MGLPIPMMFLAEDDEGMFEIVDGAQRIQTLDAFLSGDLILADLKKLDALNGFRFVNLSDIQQNKLTSRALRIVVLDQETTTENRQDLFNRINKFGRVLEASERRRQRYEGKFIDFLQICAEDTLFRNLCPITPGKEKRKEPLELVTRFFTYSERYLQFQHDVDSFIDEFVKSHRTNFEEARLASEFANTMQFVQKYFPSMDSPSRRVQRRRLALDSRRYRLGQTWPCARSRNSFRCRSRRG